LPPWLGSAIRKPSLQRHTNVRTVVSYCNKRTWRIRVEMAGVLLGKARLNSLYGLNGGRRAMCRGLAGADLAGIAGLRRRRTNKIVVF
jgi:hypothetical protein